MRLLLARPTALLLDEPSNDLDIETLQWLEQLLLGWPGALLYVSHDELLIERTANMVVHLERLRRKTVSRCTVVRGSYGEYLHSRSGQMEKQQRQALQQRREKKKRDETYRRIYQSVEHAQATISRGDPAGGRLLKKKMHAVKALERRFARQDEEMVQLPEEESAIFLEMNDDAAFVPAGKTVLDIALPELYARDGVRLLAKNVRLRLCGSEKICIVGANGVGKTTLLQTLAAQLLARTDVRAAYMPQNYEELLALQKTPMEYLAESGEKGALTRVRTLLGSLKYTPEEMEHPIAALSGGQKAKVLLLKMKLSGANVLLLDEPTRNFSPLSGAVIRQMLADYPGAILSVSHDRKYIAEVADRVLRLTPQGLQEISLEMLGIARE